MADKDEKTVKQLREDLVKLGFDAKSAEGIKTKDALEATINALQSKVESLEETADPKEERDTEKHWLAKADKMAKHLHNQEKVTVMIPLEPNEKVGQVREVKMRDTIQYQYVSGAVWSKTFNGYKVIIPKGTYYKVPQQIADNIANELNQTQQAGQHLRIDRTDPNTGRPVREQLS